VLVQISQAWGSFPLWSLLSTLENATVLFGDGGSHYERGGWITGRVLFEAGQHDILRVWLEAAIVIIRVHATADGPLTA
jgi:hypothetical protein